MTRHSNLSSLWKGRALCQGMCLTSTTETGKLEPFHAFGQAWKGNCNMAIDNTDLFAVNPHAAFYINGTINSYPVQFMIDTGAAVSLIDSNTWNRIKGQSMVKSWVDPGLVGVNGSPLKVKGTGTTLLKIHDYQYPIEVIIAALRTEAILGIDFLEANRCTIDVSQGLMSLHGHSKPITLTQPTSKMDPVEI